MKMSVMYPLASFKHELKEDREKYLESRHLSAFDGHLLICYLFLFNYLFMLYVLNVATVDLVEMNYCSLFQLVFIEASSCRSPFKSNHV
jgi:hypothetical protein